MDKCVLKLLVEDSRRNFMWGIFHSSKRFSNTRFSLKEKDFQGISVKTIEILVMSVGDSKEWSESRFYRRRQDLLEIFVQKRVIAFNSMQICFPYLKATKM